MRRLYPAFKNIKKTFSILPFAVGIKVLMVLSPPNITYPGSVTYTVGVTATPFVPTNNGGAVLSVVSKVGSTGVAPYNMATDPSGNLIFSGSNAVIYRMTLSGAVTALSAGSYYKSLGGWNGGSVYVPGDFNQPTGIAVDATGNIYVADGPSNVIRKIAPSGTISLFAGSGAAGYYDGTGAGASFNYPTGLAVDAAGNVLVADGNNYMIRKITPNGVVSTIAGNGTGVLHDGPLAAANFYHPQRVTVDNTGNIYVLDAGYIRIITTTGFVKTQYYNGSPVSVNYAYNSGLVIDGNKNLYVSGNNAIVYKITPAGSVSVFAGISGTPGSTDGPADVATLGLPNGLTLDSNGNLYIADGGNNSIRKATAAGYTITPALPDGLIFDTATGIITGTPTTIAPAAQYTVTAYTSSGSSTAAFSLNVNSAQNIIFPALPAKTYGDADFQVSATTTSGLGVTFKSSDNTVATVNNGVVHIVKAGAVTISASQPGDANYLPAAIVNQTLTISQAPLTITANDARIYSGQGNPAFTARYRGFVNNETPAVLSTPVSFTTSGSGSSGIGSYAINPGGATATNYLITYVPGTLRVAVPPPVISYTNPANYTAGTAITPLTPSNTGGGIPATIYGNVTTIAGSGAAVFAGNAAGFAYPSGVAVYTDGNIFVADAAANLIRKIDPSGTISTFAGNGASISADGVGINASFNYPTALAIDAAGNIFVTDGNGQKIRKITPNGVVTTIAGTGEIGSRNGNGAVATFYVPQGIAIDYLGNLYVTDKFNNLVRKITPDGVVSTLAGGGGGSATNGIGSAASFNRPYGITVDANGYVYVADNSNNQVRKITPDGVVSTLAGNVTAGSANGVGTAARFYAPTGIAVDDAGRVYVTDQNNNVIRQVTAAGIVTTLAGKGTTDATDGIGTLAGFAYPEGLATDQNGNLYVADARNYKIRKVVINGYSITPQLPFGLNFDNATGILSGTPSYGFPLTTYTITGYNPSGSSTATFKIVSKNLTSPKISYGTTLAYTVGATVNIAPKDTGGAIVANTYLKTIPLAGGGAVLGADGIGTEANIGFGSMRTDAAGNIYVAETFNNRIRKITPYGVTTTIAGNGQPGWVDAQDTAARFNYPSGLAVDAAGNIFVADRINYRIRKITPSGLVSTFAGDGARAIKDGVGTGASFINPKDIAIDKTGNLFVLDDGSIRKITADGTVSTFVPNTFYGPSALTIDNANNIYVAEYSNNSVEKISATGVITKIGAANSFMFPYGIAVDPTGVLYVSMQVPGGNTSGGSIYTTPGISRINLDGTIDPISTTYGNSITIDAYGNLYASNSTGLIAKIATKNYFTINAALPRGLTFDPLTGNISGIPSRPATAKSYAVTAYNSTGGNTTNFSLTITNIAAPKISYSTNSLKFTKGVPITTLTPSNAGGAVPATIYGQTTTVAGNGSFGSLNGPAKASSFNDPQGLAVGPDGSIYIADPGNHLIRKLGTDGMVSTFAGSGNNAGGDGTLSKASFNGPQQLDFDGKGNLFIRDGGIRQITPSGLVSTLYTNNYRTGTGPVTFDAAGNFYDTYINSIRKISLSASKATVMAGSIAGKNGFKDAADTAARFYGPQFIALDGAANVYVADVYNRRIRKITPAGLVTTFAGNGVIGQADGPAATASFDGPGNLVFDAAGNLFMIDGNTIRKVTPSGVVTTVAGNGTYGATDGIGSAATLGQSLGMAIDANNNLYVSDQVTSVIRKVVTTGYTISPALPSGLTFDPKTGTISGTPDSTVSAASYTITANNVGGSSTAVLSLGVSQSQVITFNPITPKTTNSADFDPGATTTSGLPITYTSSNPIAATIVHGLIHINGTGNTIITATQSGDGTYLSASASQPLKVTSPATQTITFATLPAQTYGNADFGPGATTSSALPVLYTSSDTTVATIINNKIHIVGAGKVIITATQTGNEAYKAATALARSLVIAKASQVITFNQPANQTYNGPDLSPGALATSGLPVGYTSSDTTIAKIVNGLIHFVSAGTVNIIASQAGNQNFLTAAPVIQSLTINKLSQNISFNAIPPATYGSADINPGANSSAGLPISYLSSDTTVAKIVAGALHITGTGSATITATQAGNINYTAAASVNQTLTVIKAAQTLTFSAIAVKTFGSSDFDPGATSTSGLPITYVSSDSTISKVTAGKMHILRVGSVNITASQPGDNNYLAAPKSITQKLTVAKAPQTITFAAIPNVAYGSPLFLPPATATSGLAVTFTSSDTTIVKTTVSGFQIRNVGQVTITANQTGSTNYLAATPVTQTLIIIKGNQVITFATPASKAFGSIDFTLSATSGSKQPVTFSIPDTSVVKLTGNSVHIKAAGMVSITATQAGNNLYNAAPAVVQQLVITPAAQAITFNAITAKTYGTTDFIPSAAAGSKLAVSFASSNPAVATIVSGKIHITGVGTTTITASQNGNANYAAAAQVSQSMVVNKASLIAKATNLTKTYLAVNPTLTITYTGFVNGDGPASVTTPPLISTTAITNSPAGNYPIKDSAAVAPNYNITYQPGTLTVAKAPQTITFAAIPNVAYGSPLFLPPATATSGLAVTFTSSDTTIVKTTVSGFQIRNVGQVTITANQTGSTNYLAATPVTQTLTIIKGNQVITFATPASKAFGSIDFTLSATSGSKQPVTFSIPDTSVVKLTGNSVHIKAAGTVSITANQAGNNLYNAAPAVVQQLVITPAAQAITFNAITAKTYGTADFIPSAAAGSKLAVSFASSNPAVATIVSGKIHITGVGTTTITASQLGNANYAAATQVSQSMVVNKASLIAKATNLTKTYLAVNPTLTITYTGFVNGDGPASVTTPPLISTTAITNSPAGNYPIKDSAAVAPNYNITYQPGTLTVAKAPQTITFAAMPNVAYGSPLFLPPATATSGLAVTFTSSDTTIVKTTVSGFQIRNVGQVTITANQTGSTNYLAATPVTQTLTITPAAQTITFAAIIDKVYGATDFAVSASASSKLPLALTSSNTAIATIVNGKVHIVGAGSAVITASQGGSANYSAATPVMQTVNINKAALVIKANTQTKIYGAVNPALTVTITGFVNGDTQASLAVQPKISTTALTSSPVGSYTIKDSAAVAANYNITYSAGTLVVAKAALTITANNQTKTAGSVNPVLTITYSGFVNGDGPANLTTQAKASTTAITSSPAGTYPITVGSAVSSNYLLTYVAGTLTVTAVVTHGVLTQNLYDVPRDTMFTEVAPHVRPALSPNGDGINDVLTIDNIAAYPDNKLMLIDKSGTKIFEIAGYDNNNRVFNGTSNISGRLQKAGTYFYILQYKQNGATKRATGYFILSY